jgi:precorrin-4 methylase
MKGNRVIFAGANPGDSALITIMAQKAHATADFIIIAGSLVLKLFRTERVKNQIHSAKLFQE